MIKADKSQNVSSILVQLNRSYRAGAGLLHVGNHHDAVSMTEMAPKVNAFIQQDIDMIKADMTQNVSSILVRPNRSYRAGAGLLHVGNHQYAVSMTKTALNVKAFIQQDIANIKRDMAVKISSILVRPNRSYRSVAGLLHVGNHQYAVS
jgi:uncharacterized protein YifN (PemK superfamily)